MADHASLLGAFEPPEQVVHGPSSAPAAFAAPPAAAVAAAAAKYLDAPEPEYPQAAREDEEEGLVVLQVRISPDGRIAEIHLAQSSGFPLLDRAAIVGVRHWTFQAATNGRQPIESWMNVPIRFRLR
jgi:protein TonB